MAKQKKVKTRYPGVYRAGDQWFIQATGRDRHGKKVFKSRYLPGDMPVAEVRHARSELALALSRSLEAGEAAVELRAATVADFAERWMKRKRELLKPSVRERYLRVLADHVLPFLGERTLESLTRADVEEWVVWAQRQRTKRGEPYAQDTLRSWWRVLGVLLRDAAAEVALPDPTVRVGPPKSRVRGKRESTTLTGEQLRDLLEAVRAHYPAWYAEVFVMASSGIRPGELYALRWRDVDEKAGVLHIRRSVWRGVEGTTKTHDPRQVALSAPMRVVLLEHRQRMMRAQHAGLDAGLDAGPHADLVFPGAHGQFRSAPALLKTLRLSAEAAGIPTRVTPQVLRRTVNTLLLEAGVSAVVIRSQMGHASAQMTSRYAGIHREAKLAALDRLHEMVGEVPTPDW
jgi:integrase